MKTVYIVNQQLWNGTILLGSNSSVYESLSLAEKVRNKLSNQENSKYFTATVNIESAVLYESEKEVPILNKYDN